ncbi:hypothetical protein [Kitasatospora sp. NBC_01539]|uniref:hypothetical protein n=1 Tax=Kitasatospora sp. NBC_01539 TaxID=2903577 RepID=UPI00386026F4
MSEPPESLPEDELTQLFRHVGDGFQADRPLILIGAVERGRALRRRRATTVLGGALALAAIVGGAAAIGALPVPGRERAVGSAVPTGGITAGGMTDQQMAEALRAHLRGLTVVDVRDAGSSGAEQGGAAPLVEVTVQDGEGTGAVRTAVWRDTYRTVQQTTVCEDPAETGMQCTRKDLEDGSALLIWKSGRRGTEARFWSCLLATPAGRRVSVTEWNSGRPGGLAERTDPPLGVDRLQAIALDPVWEAALPVPTGRGPAAQR